MNTEILSAAGVDVLDSLWILIPTVLFVALAWWMVKWLGKELPKESAYGDEYPKWLQPPTEDSARTLPPEWTVIRGGKRDTVVHVRTRHKSERHHSSP